MSANHKTAHFANVRDRRAEKVAASKGAEKKTSKKSSKKSDKGSKDES
jgi:hypothetical protein